MPHSHLVYFGLLGLVGVLWYHHLLSSTLGTEVDGHIVLQSTGTSVEM
jgi:hypothetical protein